MTAQLRFRKGDSVIDDIDGWLLGVGKVVTELPENAIVVQYTIRDPKLEHPLQILEVTYRLHSKTNGLNRLRRYTIQDELRAKL